MYFGKKIDKDERISVHQIIGYVRFGFETEQIDTKLRNRNGLL